MPGVILTVAVVGSERRLPRQMLDRRFKPLVVMRLTRRRARHERRIIFEASKGRAR